MRNYFNHFLLPIVVLFFSSCGLKKKDIDIDFYVLTDTLVLTEEIWPDLTKDILSYNERSDTVFFPHFTICNWNNKNKKFDTIKVPVPLSGLNSLRSIFTDISAKNRKADYDEYIAKKSLTQFFQGGKGDSFDSAEFNLNYAKYYKGIIWLPVHNLKNNDSIANIRSKILEHKLKYSNFAIVLYEGTHPEELPKAIVKAAHKQEKSNKGKANKSAVLELNPVEEGEPSEIKISCKSSANFKAMSWTGDDNRKYMVKIIDSQNNQIVCNHENYTGKIIQVADLDELVTERKYKIIVAYMDNNKKYQSTKHFSLVDSPQGITIKHSCCKNKL